jgi:hypothetical protein
MRSEIKACREGKTYDQGRNHDTHTISQPAHDDTTQRKSRLFGWQVYQSHCGKEIGSRDSLGEGRFLTRKLRSKGDWFSGLFGASFGVSLVFHPFGSS